MTSCSRCEEYHSAVARGLHKDPCKCKCHNSDAMMHGFEKNCLIAHEILFGNKIQNVKYKRVK